MVLQHGAVKPGRIPNILNMLVVQYGNNQMVILTEVSLFVAPLSLPSLSSPDTDRCMHSKCSLRGHGIATQPACQLHVRVPWVQSWEYTYYINYISLSQICWYIIFYNYMYIWYIYIYEGRSSGFRWTCGWTTRTVPRRSAGRLHHPSGGPRWRPHRALQRWNWHCTEPQGIPGDNGDVMRT